jgi:hypothetical protein
MDSLPAALTDPADLPVDKDGLIVIVLGHDEDRVNGQVRGALKRARDLSIWERGGQLVRVVAQTAEGTVSRLIRPPGAPVVRTVGPAVLRSELTRHMKFVAPVRTKTGTTIYERRGPTLPIVNYLIEAGASTVPHLAGIVEAPVFLPSGRVLQAPGYDPESQIMFIPPPGVEFLPVPEEPSAEDIHVALDWLHEAVCDFPFEDEVSRAAFEAGILSYFARWAYAGPTPFFLVDGNVRGSGKTKLVGLAATICLGRKPFLCQQTTDDKLEKELITGVALSGAMMVLVDNISRPFGSAPLDSALTETVWTPVLKYDNHLSQLPLYAIWWGSGNNVQFHRHCDTPRRTLRIRLRSPHERPEERSGFRHDLDTWAPANRRHLVWAALTLLRGFHCAGRPVRKDNGGFNGWSRMPRAALLWAGEPDPWDACASKDESADATAEALGQFLRGYRELLGMVGKPALTAQELLTELQAELEYRREKAGHQARFEGLIGAICTLEPPRGNARLPDSGALGRMLRSHKERPIDGLFLEPSAKLIHGVRLWSVKETRREAKS